MARNALKRRPVARPTSRVTHAVHAKALFEGYSTQRIGYVAPEGFVATNPSIFYDGRMWRCMIRCINYSLGKPLPRTVTSTTTMLELRPRTAYRDVWCIDRTFPMRDVSGRGPPRHRIRGYEDARLFHWRSGLWASATCCDLTPRGHREIVLLELGWNYDIVSVTPMRGPWSTSFQKNWIPMVDEVDTLRFLYSVERGLALRVSPAVNGESPRVDAVEMRGELAKPSDRMAWGGVGILRGSSQAMPMGDGTWLVLVHDRRYRSQFLTLSSDLRITHSTPEFHFRETGVEFSAGCAVDFAGDRVIASFSVKDATAELAAIPMASLRHALIAT